MPNWDIARESLGVLVSEALTPGRFRKWKTSLTVEAGQTLSKYGFGEIFWRKSLGKPTSAHLADAFTLECWREQIVLVGQIGGPARETPLRVPYAPSLWDGKDDDTHWRVLYMIPNLAKDITHLVPHFNRDVPWTGSNVPLGLELIGPKALEPSGVTFEKEDGPVHFSFEVVRRPLLVSP